MRYEGRLYRPPSEAHSYILQATIGCSHNLCTYCAMYTGKKFRIREVRECIEDLDAAASQLGRGVDKMFVADGDSLIMGLDHWVPILERARDLFPRLKQVSCYAMARNVLEKSEEELAQLRELGLNLLYIGPETGDPKTLKTIVKGNSYEDHVEAARKAHGAGISISVIMLLGAGGEARSEEHAEGTARLVTDMDPEYLSALTLTPIPGTPLQRMIDKGRFVLPNIMGLLAELRTIVDQARPSDALFRTNHASNYLPISGRLPTDRARIVGVLDAALAGEIPLRPEWARGL